VRQDARIITPLLFLLTLALTAGLAGAAPPPQSAPELEEEQLSPGQREQRERQIARRIREAFLQGLTTHVDLSEEQLEQVLPILEGLESRRQESLRRRRAVMTQLRGLVEDPLSETEEIQRKIATVDQIDADLLQAEEQARGDLRALLDPRQEAQLLVFREQFRQRIEQRLRGLARERRQREEMRRGLEPRRNAPSRGEEAP
jgi:hypothetical protein